MSALATSALTLLSLLVWISLRRCPRFWCLFFLPFRNEEAAQRVPRESFKVIFYVRGYFHFARLFLEALRKYPLKQA